MVSAAYEKFIGARSSDEACFPRVSRHDYPNAEARFPALKEVPHLNPFRALLLSGIICTCNCNVISDDLRLNIYYRVYWVDLIWQLLYWKFVLINRRKKIESGQRTTSFSFLLNDKRGVIGRALSSVPPAYREASFMAGQLVYSVLTELPAVFLLYDSPFWSAIFLLFIFSVSVWNGGGFYIEVFGRKYVARLYPYYPATHIPSVDSSVSLRRFAKSLRRLVHVQVLRCLHNRMPTMTF